MGTTAAMMVADATARIQTLTAAQVEAHVLGGACQLVDVREPEELDEQGLIAGAHHVPRGLLEFWADPANPLHRPTLDPTRTTILYCAVGSRSALAARTLQEIGYADVAHLGGGIAAWKQAGLPVVGLKTWHLHDGPRTTSHRGTNERSW